MRIDLVYILNCGSAVKNYVQSKVDSCFCESMYIHTGAFKNVPLPNCHPVQAIFQANRLELVAKKVIHK